MSLCFNIQSNQFPKIICNHQMPTRQNFQPQTTGLRAANNQKFIVKFIQTDVHTRKHFYYVLCSMYIVHGEFQPAAIWTTFLSFYSPYISLVQPPSLALFELESYALSDSIRNQYLSRKLCSQNSFICEHQFQYKQMERVRYPHSNK